MHRFKFVVYRPMQLLPALFGISLITFVLIYAIPGDAVRTIPGEKATPETSERVRAQFRLAGRPVAVLSRICFALSSQAEGADAEYRAPWGDVRLPVHECDQENGAARKRALWIPWPYLGWGHG